MARFEDCATAGFDCALDGVLGCRGGRRTWTAPCSGEARVEMRGVQNLSSIVVHLNGRLAYLNTV